MNRETCKKLREQINAALKKLGEEIGMSIAVSGNASFSDTYVTFKVTACEVNATTGVVQTPEASAYRQLSHYDGLPACTLGWTFTSMGKTYEIVGYNSKASKSPIIARHDGKNYVFPAAGVVAVLKAQKPKDFEEALAADKKERDAAFEASLARMAEGGGSKKGRRRRAGA